jgi:hypothetical protein
MSIKKYNKNKEERINFLISKELKKEYKLFCIKNDYIMSDRIREFIELELKHI